MAEELIMLENKNPNFEVLKGMVFDQEAMALLAELVANNRVSPKPKYGNPGVVGLAAFGLTTMVLQFHNIGWMDSIGPVVCLGLIFGGLAQMIAGLQEYTNGNNFGYSAFTTYGAFWISLSVMLIANKLDLYPSLDKDIGFFLIAFTLYTCIMWVASFCISVALCIVFFLLFLGFVLLDIEHFHKDLVGFKRAAGWVLLFCAIGAWYCMAHIIYKDAFGKDMLPVGPAPSELISKIFAKRKSQNVTVVGKTDCNV